MNDYIKIPRNIFNEIIAKLISIRWEYRIYNLCNDFKEEPALNNIPKELFGQDILVLYTYYGNDEYVVMENDTEKLNDLLITINRLTEDIYEQTFYSV